MAYARKKTEDLEQLVRTGGKKFVRYEEGAGLFSMGLHSFEDLAKEAGAIYRVRRVVLVNVQKVEEYLEKECRESR